MSFFKFFGSGAGKDKKSKKKEGNQEATDYGFTSKEEEEEAMKSLPAFRGGNKADRNLSISRSGRHKLKAKQRTVLSNDLYHTASQSSSQSASHQPPAAAAGISQGGGSRGTAGMPTGGSSGGRGAPSRPSNSQTNYYGNANAPPGAASAASKGQGSFGRTSGANWGASGSSTNAMSNAAPPRARGQPTAV